VSQEGPNTNIKPILPQKIENTDTSFVIKYFKQKNETIIINDEQKNASSLLIRLKFITKSNHKKISRVCQTSDKDSLNIV